jgi:hypothetical protein
MVATQRAGWAWYAHWRNLLIAFAAIAIFETAILAALNAFYGTKSNPADPLFVIAASAALTVFLCGLLFLTARSHARQVLHKGQRLPWDGAYLGGEQAWNWDGDELHMRHQCGCADLSWASVGAWLDAPEVLLLFPLGGRPFGLPEPGLAAGWLHAPKVFLFPFGGNAVSMPKRVLAAGDAGRLADMLRSEGVPERRRFGLIAAGSAGTTGLKGSSARILQ